MYVRNVATIQNSNKGGPECVNTADNFNTSPGGDDLIATPGSAV
jgi:hypothetical protein